MTPRRSLQKWVRRLPLGYCLAPRSRFIKIKLANESHQQIRDLIGGLSISRKIELPNSEGYAKYTECEPYILRIMANLGHRYQNQVLNPAFVSLHDLCKGTVTVGKRSVRTGKHIMDFAQRYKLCNNTQLTQLSKDISKLGEIWAEAKTKKQEFYLNLDTSYEAFIKLGHYGCDNGSCFGQERSRENDKHSLAQRSNTFVMYFTTTEAPELNFETRAAVRLWGAINPNNRLLSISNIYTNGDIPRGNMLKAVKDFTAELFLTPPERIKESTRLLRVPHVYQNGDDITYTPGEPVIHVVE